MNDDELALTGNLPAEEGEVMPPEEVKGVERRTLETVIPLLYGRNC